MSKGAYSIPSSEDTVASEVAVLERAASGLRDALQADRAFSAVIEEDRLRFRGVAPVGTPMPPALELSEHEPIQKALAEGVVVPWPDTPEVFGSGPGILVPWTSRGEVLGVGVVMGSSDGAEEDPLLALVGAKTGSSIAAHRDCSDLARRVASLQDTDAVLEAVIEASSDAIKIVDLDGCVRRWNSAAERLYGWSFDEVSDRKMPHVSERSRLRAVQDIRGIAAAGTVVRRKANHVRSDGSPVAVEITAIPVMDGEGHPYGVVSIAHQVDADAVVLEKGGVLAPAIAQGIRAPLTALVGYAQLLARSEIVDDPVRRSRTVKALEERASELNRFVEDILMLSELRHDTIEFDREPVDLTGLVADVVGRHDERDGDTRFLIDFESGIPPVVVDRRRTDRALERLLVNAAAYVTGSDMAVKVFVHQNHAVVRVTDRGSGMMAEEATAALSVFDRSSRTSDVGSIPGIELFLVKEIVEGQGGSVDVEVVEGEGTSISVCLPVKEQREG